MKAVVQRVLRGRVLVDGETVGEIGPGAVILVGVEEGDSTADADGMADKIGRLRFFPGATPMDRTLAETGGCCLVVSQFTLAADLRKGNRPSFTRAMAPDVAEPLYLRVGDRLEAGGLTVARGVFGASMQVELVNDGPITFLLDVRGGKVR